MENKIVKVLAIDDNHDNLISLKALIAESLPEVKTLLALSGTGGLELAKSEGPDVILLDIVMPGMDGYEVCRRLKADSLMKDIPVVFVTALKGDRESRIRALEAGAEAFLAKPVDPSELTAQIRAMVKIKDASIKKRDETIRLAQLVDDKTHDLKLAHVATLKLLDDLNKENEARKKSEIELLQTKETYLDIFNTLTEAIYVQDAETGAFIDVNRGTENIYGMTRKEIIGQTPFTIAAPGLNDLDSIWEKSKEVFNSGIPVSFDFWAVRKNGEVFPKEVFVSRGKYFGKDVLIATARDITEKKAAEEKLIGNLAYTKALLAANPDMMFVFDDQCNIVDYNTQSSEGLYVPPDVFIGKKPEEVLPPDVAIMTREMVINVLKTGENEYITYSLEMNGETRFFESRGVPFGKEKVLAFVRDITERKVAEESLRENQKFLNLVLQTVPDPVTVVRLSDNVCLQINLEYTQLMGWTADEVIGHTYKDFNSWVNPNDRVKLIETLKKDGFVDSQEAMFRTKYNQVITGLISARLLTLKGEKCIVTITRDITERKKREEAMMASQERVRLQQAAVSQLILDDAVTSVDMTKAFDHFTETVCNTTNVERTSIWLLSDDETQLVCKSLFEAGTGTFGERTALKVADFPNYFEAIRLENLISASNVLADPRTSELAEGYLNVAGITSMLDAGIQIEGRLIGVVCLEHVGDMRKWYTDEESFVSTIAAMVGQLIASDRRKQAEMKVNAVARHYQALIEKAPDGIVLINDKDNFIYASPSARRMFGYNETGEIEASPARLTHPDDLPMVLDELSKIIQNPAYIPLVTYRFMDNHNNWHWIESSFTNLLGNSDVNAIVINFRDVTDRKTAELELQEKERFIKSIAENSPDVIYLFSIQERRNVYTNRSIALLLGYSADEISDHDPEFFHKLIHPDDQKQFDSFYDEIEQWNENQVFDFEYRIRAKSGGWRWFKGREKEFSRIEGKIVSVIGNVQDVTEMKLTEQAVFESEEKFRLLITQMEQGMAVHEAIFDDSGQMTDYRFIDVNESFERLTGLKRQDILGKKVMEVLPGTEKYWIEAYSRVVKTGKPLHFENFHSEIGKYYEVVAYRNRENQFAVIVNDISQRKVAEITQHIQYNVARHVLVAGSLLELVTQVQGELTKLLDTTNFLVAHYDSQKHEFHKVVYQDEKDEFVTWKAENSLSGQVVGKKKTLLLNRRQIQQLAEDENLHLFGTPAECWLGVPLMTRTRVYGALVLQSYSDPDAYDAGNAKLLEMVAHEISIFIERQQMIEDLKAAKVKAEENDRLKSAFLANMSHEIRTPMNGILGFTDLLKDPDNTPSDQIRYLEVIEKSGQRLLNLINDLIDISKIEAGQVTVTLSEVDILQETQNLHAFFLPETDRKSVQLSLHLHRIPGRGKIITDKDKFLSIYTNLIKNAIKFTDEGKIEFGYEMENGYVRFFVKDTGRGIPYDKQEMIFERFGQADVSLTRNHEGAGLGLSISKAYAEMMGGTIGLISQPGVGSEFYFTLPLPPQTQQIPTHRKEGLEKPGTPEFTKKLRILVAEDDEFSIQYFSIKLKNIASEIHYTRTGTETVEFCRKNPDTDLVLMDIKMAGIDGLEATRKIREFNKSIIIIAQTAYALSGDREISLEAGCNDYLAKPIKNETLYGLVEKFFH